MLNDIKEEIKQLDLSNANLRKFGIIVGIVFLLISAFLLYKEVKNQKNEIFNSFNILCSSSVVFNITIFLGIFLITFGVLFPQLLKNIYKAWMGIAFTMGGIVFRIFLFLIFYFVLTPIGLIGKLLKYEFLNTDFNKQKEKQSYWIKRKKGQTIDYKKMY